MQKNNLIIDSIKLQKFPILITVSFFLISSYVAFVHHNYWVYDIDGKFYLDKGIEILNGDGKNVILINAPVVGPIIYAFLDSFFNDGFNLMKTIAILSSTGIIYFSYFIMKNIFDKKTAIISQLFFIFNPYFLYFSIQAENELLPFFLMIVSLYLLTKPKFGFQDVLLSGALLGIASIIRYQFITVFLSFVIFLLLHKIDVKKKIYQIAIFSGVFLIFISIIFIYNYQTYESILGEHNAYYISQNARFITTESFQGTVISEGLSEFVGSDLGLFIQNYFYNLLYNNPSWLFNFNNIGNISVIPPIPYLGLIPILGGLLYIFKESITKRNLKILACITIITLICILFIGDISVHFSALFIIPIISLGILHFRNIKENFLPILLIPICFILPMSVIRLFSGEQFFIMLIWTASLSAIFWVKMIPAIYFKIKKVTSTKKSPRGLKIITIAIIAIIFASDLGYSFVLLRSNSSGIPFESINEEFLNLFSNNDFELLGSEIKHAGIILSNEPGIENKYVMTSNYLIAPYVNSNIVMALYNEGSPDDTIENFITRETWSNWEIRFSNLNSRPSDITDQNHPIPDYFIWMSHATAIRHGFIEILSDSKNPNIPSNFEPIFVSDKIDLIIYKIHKGLE